MMKLSPGISLPEAVLSQHMAVLGKTRSGKSSVMRLFVEHLLDRKERVCVIDPKGDWHGLRASADGKSAGYPVVIFGGSKADVPLNAHAGASVAELVATGNRPCVIDLGGWMVGERTRFFIDFASTLFRSIGSPLRLVIDEVHNFAPQSKVEKNPDAMKMLHWANRLASEGAGKGLVLLSASQRPQKVHKDYLTCAETLVAMRVIHPLDRAAIADWISGCPDPAKGREVLSSLASMARGEGWVWSPEAGFGPERVKFPLFKTYDSFAAPTGKAAVALKGWADVDLADVTAKLSAVVEEAKANDPKELKRQIAELRKQLATKPAGTSDPAAIERAVKAALAAQEREWSKAIKEREDIIDTLKGRMGKAATLLQVNGEAAPAPVKIDAGNVPSPHVSPRHQRSAIAPQSGAARESRATESTGDLNLGKAERAILCALYWLRGESITPAKVGFYANYSAGSGSFNNALGRLRSTGLLAGWEITEAGQSVAESLGAGPKPVGSELREWLRRKLGKAENALLDALVESHPSRLPDEELAAASGYSAGSGSFNNALGRLRSIEAAEGYARDGGTKASDVFFE